MAGINYSLNALMEFARNLSEQVAQGKSKAKAKGRLTACRVVLKNLLPEEAEDVRKIDIDAAASKYGSRTGAKKKTVVEYRNRIKSVIAEFESQVDKLSNAAHDGSDDKPSLPSVKKEAVSHTAKRRPYPRPAIAANTISVQVRQGFLAQLILPLDLKASEAEHLCKLIKALPMDQVEA